ncbi:hypothetical protein MPSI1_002579 [Malassezia psittaci]|uniref:Uncharacterized protein n=1 Tax=Malassezia psittaci TaxID=1821823 RepID=A0AAF0FBJ3_9BASI|nr:hypothetical protein MPSI1_002579 [Malassezia psittaci]
MGVTVVIQQLITMLITSSLCNHDVRHGVKALEHPWPPLMHFPANPTPAGSYLGTDHPKVVAQYGQVPMGNATNRSRFVQFVFWFIRAMCTGSERNAFLLRGLTMRQRVERLLWTAAQGLWVAVLSFWWFWPIGIAIVSPIWEHDNLRGTWTPPLIKLVYGALLGLLTNPFIALLTLGAECNVRRTHPDLMIWSEDTRRGLIAQDPVADKAVLHRVEVE